MSMRVVVDNEGVTLRAGAAADAPALHGLISRHVDEGRLLPRSRAELTAHAGRFIVAVRGADLVGCAELAPLSADVAEIRSLVVEAGARGSGLGQQMVDALARRARRDGFARLCAFAHDPTFFIRLGFSIVPHTWVPEKIARDCTGCALFRRCGQHALTLSLDRASACRAPGDAAAVHQAVSGA